MLVQMISLMSHSAKEARTLDTIILCSWNASDQHLPLQSQTNEHRRIRCGMVCCMEIKKDSLIDRQNFLKQKVPHEHSDLSYLRPTSGYCLFVVLVLCFKPVGYSLSQLRFIPALFTFTHPSLHVHATNFSETLKNFSSIKVGIQYMQYMQSSLSVSEPVILHSPSCLIQIILG